MRDEKQLLGKFRYALEEIMASDEVYEMSQTEVRNLGSALAKVVGDVICDQIAIRLQARNKFFKMTDEEFENFLKEKYGKHWVFMSLTPEEFERVPSLDLDTLLKDISSVGESLANVLNCNGVRIKGN
jgi:hypothetical protein